MKILVIGTGSIGHRHAGNLGALGATVETVSIRDGGLASALKHIADGADGAVIATETQIRLDLIEAAANKSMPLYIEKPLAFDPDTISAIYAAATKIAERSMVGFMVRYHPAFRHLARANLSDTYRYSFEIGHDVTQWRQNWSFADSYAAKPQGGGVLLDLCHEIDMAHCLFPGVLGDVESIGHTKYPGVDMATQVTRQGPALGLVSMDYLSPRSTRRIEIAGTETRRSFDLIEGRYADGEADLKFPFERNQMFLGAMHDFLALIAGAPTSSVEHLPRLDRVRASCEEIAAAHAARRFTGHLEGGKP